MASSEAPSSSSSADAPSEYTVEGVRAWLVENKLRTVGTLWATSVGGSLLLNMRKPGEKFSVKLIHARLHAQGLTLAALVAAAGVEYWEHRSRAAAQAAASPSAPLPEAVRGLHVST